MYYVTADTMGHGATCLTAKIKYKFKKNTHTQKKKKLCLA